MVKSRQPLVSCIMPTYNRREYIPHAIRFFLKQDYPNKELVIVDDSDTSSEDIIPSNSNIRYLFTDRNMSLGEKRNFCIRESRGDLIMHWDDDDWMAPNRISYQVKELLNANAEVCGLTKMFFCELTTANCWLYEYPANAKTWLAGGSLLYTKNFWREAPFPDQQQNNPFVPGKRQCLIELLHISHMLTIDLLDQCTRPDAGRFGN